MDKAGVLVPHGVGGYARTMLAAAAHRLAHPAPAPDVALIDVPHQECYSDGDGDTWFDCPDDAEFTQGRKVGDTYEVQVSHYSIRRTYIVTKVPDDTSDDYEVEPFTQQGATNRSEERRVGKECGSTGRTRG